ncbi:DNA-3-methyladenine glycosylase [Halyomorpha halys]|uniref:DNA-3-methyladenine glycosylase n=1 Tax=Halyomorpha halys TaxID=286706 RepID=UPI0006D4D8CE|nr:DNA-3-methyladenine glycosylase [Halyomorpha halys]
MIKFYTRRTVRTIFKRQRYGNEELSPHFSNRLSREFFDVPCLQLAKSLLGQVLVRRENDFTLKGRIVETEAYIAGDDMASHSHHGKMTERTAPTFMAPGTIYVTSVYGMYHVFNISSQGDGACVLLRSLEPISGLEEMKRKRSFFGKSAKKQLKSYRLHEVCNGPSKLAIAFSIDKTFSGDDLVTSSELWIEAGPEKVNDQEIVECPRIGINFAGPVWASKPFRYYLIGNSCVSKRDKYAEEQMKAVIKDVE